MVLSKKVKLIHQTNLLQLRIIVHIFAVDDIFTSFYVADILKKHAGLY